MRELLVIISIIICLKNIVNSSELVEDVNKIILTSKLPLTNLYVCVSLVLQETKKYRVIIATANI